MTSVAAGTWAVDLARTRAAFAARHLFGQTVHGTIAVTAGTIEVGTDGRPQRFHATLDPASVGTGHARRDKDLRSKRFLAVGAYPLMEVVADRIAATADGWYADAVLRAHGREAPLRIDATLDAALDGALNAPLDGALDAALDGTATEPGLQVSGTARLDLRDLGIRVPGFFVRRFVSLSVTAQLKRQPS
jgi:polyisoprenoid-binding protein YceI